LAKITATDLILYIEFIIIMKKKFNSLSIRVTEKIFYN
jgi:hypothetical protein